VNPVESDTDAVAQSPVTRDSIEVLLIDDDETWVRTQQRVLDRQTDAITAATAYSLSEARDRLVSSLPDCIVCDYQLGDGTGLDLLIEIRDRLPELPFILVTGQGDEAVASDAISEQVTDYVRKTDLGSQPALLSHRIEAIVETYRTKRALAHERRSKEALLEIVTTNTARHELGRNICRHLVEERHYEFAWIGGLDDTKGIIPLSTTGATDYLETVLHPETRPDSESEPALAALAQNDSMVISSLNATESPNGLGDSDGANGRAENSDRTRWEKAASRHGFRSVAAVPIEHDTVCFGVLAVYDTAAERIDDREFDLLVEYANAVGYALQATEWKQTLLSSPVGSAEFTIDDDTVPLVALSTELPQETKLEVTTVIPRNDTEVLYLTTVTGASTQALTEAVRAVDAVRSVEVYQTGDQIRCGFVAETPVPEMIVVETGAQFDRTAVADGHARISATSNKGVSARQVGTALQQVYQSVSVNTIWTDRARQPSSDANDPKPLTGRQQQVLELAIDAGYFDRPRKNNTGEIAEMLDISPATFTQHLRAAQRKTFASHNFEPLLYTTEYDNLMVKIPRLMSITGTDSSILPHHSATHPVVASDSLETKSLTTALQRIMGSSNHIHQKTVVFHTDTKIPVLYLLMADVVRSSE
jgi:predicted DNA binding protein/ActR/RegA family two-component response regulator